MYFHIAHNVGVILYSSTKILRRAYIRYTVDTSLVALCETGLVCSFAGLKPLSCSGCGIRELSVFVRICGSCSIYRRSNSSRLSGLYLAEFDYSDDLMSWLERLALSLCFVKISFTR